MPIRRETGFIFIEPYRADAIWTVTIDSLDVTEYILSGKFPMGLITEELVCEIELENSGETFTDRFDYGDVIEFKMDFSDGSTLQFSGEVEEIRKKIGNNFTLNIKGSHWTSRALDVTVTEEFTNSQISSIRSSLISSYLSGFTSTNIESNIDNISIKFVNKALLDCLIDLDKQGDEDSYFDNIKDLHSFKKNSKTNNNVHFNDEGSMLELKGLGSDTINVKNKIIVYGEAGGLPVIHTSEDSISQSNYRIKEKVITDTSITTEDHANEIGDAEKIDLKDPKTEGSCIALWWTSLSPGDRVMINSPIHRIHNYFRIVKFVYTVPERRMEVYFNQERSISKLLKKRIIRDQQQENIVNPFKMTRSYTFTFDDNNLTDSAASSGIVIENGKIRKNTAVEKGIFISLAKFSDKTANSAHLKVIGEQIDGASYFLRANTNSDFQQITPNNTTAEIVSSSGKNITLKIEITSANTRIDSAGLYWKE